MDKDLSELAKKYPEVFLLLLFGSRARGHSQEHSDWDFGYVAAPTFDSAELYNDLVLLLKTEKVDLVDLSKASGLLRFRAARDGITIFEAVRGEYEKFWLQAVDFWCDAGSLLRSEYNAILKGL